MTHIQQRRGPAAEWTATDPILLDGEVGHETDTGKWKIGDGSTAWTGLPYKSGVDSVAGRTGDVALAVADVSGAAPLASPAFTGNPTAPTPLAADNDTSIATTAFVKAAVAALVDSSPGALDTLNELAAALGDDPNFATTINNALALKAPLASPALTGNPTAPTPAAGDNDTSLATTEFVKRDAPRGVLGYAQVVTSQTGIGSTPTNLTGLSVTVTVGASRRIRISGHVGTWQLTSAAQQEVQIYEGATRLQRTIFNAPLNAFHSLTPAVVVTPSAGAHTYNLKLANNAGSTDTFAASDAPAFILVEDIGPV